MYKVPVCLNRLSYCICPTFRLRFFLYLLERRVERVVADRDPRSGIGNAGVRRRRGGRIGGKRAATSDTHGDGDCCRAAPQAHEAPARARSTNKAAAISL